jgi:hypothetical protein
VDHRHAVIPAREGIGETMRVDAVAAEVVRRVKGADNAEFKRTVVHL